MLTYKIFVCEKQMIQVETIKFNKPIHQNDISFVENLIYPIFSKKTKKNQKPLGFKIFKNV